MSIDRCGVGHVTLFVVSIALCGSVTASSAAQTTQQPATPIDAVSPADQKSGVDPVTGKSKSEAKPPAPTPGARLPGSVSSPGKVGPGGKATGHGAPSSPDGPAKIKDPAIERLGPGGTAGKPNPARLDPGETALQTKQGPRSEVVTPSSAPGSSPESNKPAAKGGVRVFIDPATGLIAEPTEAQLREAEAMNPTVNLSVGDVVERPALVGGGMIADVPESLFPVVTASVGSDGKLTLTERAGQLTERTGRVTLKSRNGQAPSSAVAAPSPGGDADQHVQAASSAVAARGPGGDADQHVAVTAPGPAGDADQHVVLPALSADVTISIVNQDGAGEGFNDLTAVAPVFGNPGTTRGQQRLNAFRAAAEYWGAILRSTVPIRIDAKMDPQTCSATSAVLGSAGPNTLHRDFAGAPFAATYYVQAVANSRVGVDQDAQSDISATFNSDVDNPVCLGATSWWYGIGAPAPAGTIDFYTTVLHEIGHGVGFLSLVSLATGAKFNGFDDAYMTYLWDWTVGLGWPGMTNAQRLASSVNTGQVIFYGPRATEAARGFLSAGNNLGYPRVFAPNPVQPGSSISHYDTVATPNELMEPAITPPPGPYAFLTSGLLQDVGWNLLANGIFDFGASGTWTWNPTDGWFSPGAANPADLEPFNGNFVGSYNGTWLWNETTGSWTQLTTAIPSMMKACRDNLLWASGGAGTWRWNPSTGWQQLSALAPETLGCLGADMVWENAAFGTWLYNIATAGWLQITTANPTAVRPCGAQLAWWRAGETWYWDAVTGWHFLTSLAPETTECYRDRLAWESAASGTWLYNFTAGTWQQITSVDAEQLLAWGPNLVWDGGNVNGTWIFDGVGWSQITTANPTRIEVLADHLLWGNAAGTWVWSGGGAGTAWTGITTAVPTEIISSGAVR